MINDNGTYGLLAAYKRASGSNWLAWFKGEWPLGTVLSFIYHVNRVNSCNGSVMMTVM